MVQNKGLIFKQVSKLPPTFDLDTEPPVDGVTTKNYYASFNPYQRARMASPEKKSYFYLPFELGKPITSSVISKVLKSANSKFKEDDLVIGMILIAEYSIIPASTITNHMLRKLDNPYNLDLKLYLGALGMPGLIAYSSLYSIGEPKKGETIFISAASGAAGQVVGQLAKHGGLTVIGSVGSNEKLDFIRNDLQFDNGFNYEKEKAREALARLAPNGIDIYYENVGGELLEAALEVMTNHGRIGQWTYINRSSRRSVEAYAALVTCGMISQYKAKPDEQHPIKSLSNVVWKRLKMQGFIVGDPDMGPRYAAEHQKNVAKQLSENTVVSKQSNTEGIDNAVDGFLGMLKGENFGKAVLTIGELD
ncbi:MAG: hypothetical protein Q9184_002999 [Pyrenodesmia sp. 2 TL-2023]